MEKKLGGKLAEQKAFDYLCYQGYDHKAERTVGNVSEEVYNFERDGKELFSDLRAKNTKLIHLKTKKVGRYGVIKSSKSKTVKKQCPNCKSFKTISPFYAYGIGGLVLAVLALPWIIIIIGIPFVLAGIILSIVGFTKPRNLSSYNHCKYQWIVSK